MPNNVYKAHFFLKVLAFTDGETVSMMPPAQDHKRIGDGDTGPNTGGMGAYAPCPLITRDQLADVQDQVLQRAIDGLKAEGIKYVGEFILLYNLLNSVNKESVLMALLSLCLCVDMFMKISQKGKWSGLPLF